MPTYPLPTSGITGADIGSHPGADDDHVLQHYQVNEKLNALCIDVAADFGADMTGGTDSSAQVDAALDEIGTAVGTLWIPPGTLKVEPDVLKTRGAGQFIRGAGEHQTIIDMTGTGTWGVKAEHSYCEIGGFSLNTDSAVTYGVGVSTPASSGTASIGRIERISVNPGAAMIAAFTLGPDWPGSSSVDVAAWELRKCVAFPNTGGSPTTGLLDYGFLFGNGTSGNVAQNEAHGCSVVAAEVGVGLAGSGIVWFGGGFGYVTEADIKVLQASGTPIAFYGVRAEVGAMVLKHGYVGRGYGPIILSGYEATAYDPVDGETIINCATHLILLGGAYYTVGGNAKAVVDEFNGGGLIFEAHGVSFDSDDPYRSVSSTVTRNTSGTIYDDASVPTSNPSADAAGGWNAYTPTIGGTGWAIGNGFVNARWKAISGVVHVEVIITWGSTSTFGSAALTISFPTGALPSANINLTSVKALGSDEGSNLYNLNAYPDTTKVAFYAQGGTNGDWGGPVISTVPFTWASTDSVMFSAAYEAA